MGRLGRCKHSWMALSDEYNLKGELVGKSRRCLKCRKREVIEWHGQKVKQGVYAN